MRIERAEPTDLPAVKALLTEAGLPLDGVPRAFATGVVARSDDDDIVGAAAVEPHGTAALVRSVVVRFDSRGTGIARDLVVRVEDLARDVGADETYLITETAAGYFLRLGYVEVARSEVPDPIAASIEFTTACSSSAVVMRRSLA